MAPESWKADGGLDRAEQAAVGPGRDKAVIPTLCPRCSHITQNHPDRTFQRTVCKNASHSAEDNDKCLESTQTQMLLSSGHQQPSLDIIFRGAKRC